MKISKIKFILKILKVKFNNINIFLNLGNINNIKIQN